MNKILLIALLAFAVGCSPKASQKEEQANPVTEAQVETKQEQETEVKEGHEHEGLKLNNGSKWKLDDATRTNIAAIKASLKDTRDHSVLATSLREKSNKLISDCRMSGPDHDALHLWLEKFLGHLGELEKPNAGQREEAVKVLKEDISEFDRFFE